MSKLFPNHIIDLEKGTVFSKKYKKYIGSLNNGYYEVRTRDIFGTLYTKVHQIVFADGANYPKHLWPIDKNGKRFVVDHINTNRSDNRFENLRLGSYKDNSNNPITKKNQSEARKKIEFTDEWRHNLSEAQKKRFENPEERKKMSETSKMNWKNEETILKLSTPIYQYTIDGIFIKFWISRNQIERELGYNRERISFHCKDGKPYKGCIWSKIPL